MSRVFDSQNSWFSVSRADERTRLRLVCFAHAGGNAKAFRSWGEALAPEIQVVAIELPGRERRIKEAPYDCMEPLVTALLPQFDSAFDRPFAFFGHSLGAKIAFATAQALTREGRPAPSLLIASACPAPHLVDPRPALHLLPTADFVAELRRLQGTPEALLDNAEFMSLVLPYLRADYQLSESYRADLTQPLSIPIVAFGGSEDSEATVAELCAWQEQTQADFDLRMFRGNHFYVDTDFNRVMRTIRELTMLAYSARPTQDACPRSIVAESGASRVDGRSSARGERDVAVIGMAGRFPGARNVAELWDNLCAGKCSIRVLSEEELSACGVDARVRTHSRFVRATGRLADVERFDASFFGMSASEAALTDPQQRLLLEHAWAALEDAGQVPGDVFGTRTGVYAAASPSTYGVLHARTLQDPLDPSGALQILLGNSRDFLAPRISCALSLRGPSVTVQSASSSSLVAVHLAIQGLLAGDCDVALVGGVCVTAPSLLGHVHERGGKDSPDGFCRAFSANAAGTVWGNGVGVLVLKRLANAMASGDRIHAVIKGSAVNNDAGATHGMTAPSAEGQADAIVEALVRAGVNADTIGYVEAHGTGTQVGDPVEFRGLTQAFRKFTARKGYCSLGSIKPNIGHLDAAAGVASLIKAILAVEAGLRPPLLHHSAPNPQLDVADSPFRFETRLEQWPDTEGPRRAGVSSFGMGGTNAHVVIEQAPTVLPVRYDTDWEIVPITAKTPRALHAACSALASHLERDSGLELSEVSHTLQVGRKHFNYRRAVVCRTTAEAARELHQPLRGVREAAAELRVAFLFPGQGSHYRGMAAEVYARESVFRHEFDLCSEYLAPYLGADLRKLVLVRGQEDGSASWVSQTSLVQPALFVTEYALAKLWMKWGVVPSALLGHSIGEYVAACLAGVFSLPDALRLVAERGRLMQSTLPGSMLVVPLAESDVRGWLSPQLSLAATNAPTLCVIAGLESDIDATAQTLVASGILTRKLNNSRAFHSALMDPVLDQFRDAVAQITLSPPTMPFVSNVTGTWITPSQAIDPDYWAQHLRATVRFREGVTELLAQPATALLEVGPGQALTTLTRQCARGDERRLLLSSLPRAGVVDGELCQLRKAVASLWQAGARIDFSSLRGNAERMRRTSLPTYPFESLPHWIEPSTSHEQRPEQQGRFVQTVTGKRPAPIHSQAVGGTPPANSVRPIVQQLVNVWQELLGVENIAPDSDFTGLGGHSLLATRLLARVESDMGVQVSLSQFFQEPTPEALARIVEESRAASAPPTRLAPDAPWSVKQSGDRWKPFPLTELQQAYWVGRRPGIDLGGVACRTYVEFDRDALDIARFELALRRLIDRHDMLRAIVTEDGQQRVLDAVPAYEIKVNDFRSESPQAVERRINELRAAKSHHVFATDRWPLFDVEVSRLPNTVRLHIGIDLLFADAHSLEIIAHELRVFYDDADAKLPPVEITFRECVLASEERERSDTYRRAEAYWRARLSELPGGPCLPLSQSPASLNGHRFRRHQGRVSGQEWQRLVERAALWGLTPSALLLAAFAEVLAKWSSEPRFCLTLTLFNRAPLHPHVNNVVGDFTSVALLPVDTTGAQSFVEHAKRVQRDLWDVLDHRDFSGIRVLREWARSRGGNQAINVPVIFTSLLDQAKDAHTFWASESWLGRLAYGITQTPQVWLDHQVYREADGIGFNWDVVDGLFPSGMVEDMFGAYCALLAHICEDSPNCQQAQSMLRLPARQLDVRAAVNHTQKDIEPQLLHKGVELWARSHPNALAVIDPPEQLTYRELNRRANVIARKLIEASVPQGSLVAIAMHKGWEQIVAALGILKAGGAYLPVDPFLPQKRLDYIFHKARVRIALTKGDRALDASSCSDVEVWSVREMLLHSGDAVEQDPPHVQSLDDLAYVIFTSGSTGEPKGVMISHRGAFNTIADINERLGVTASDRVLSLSALNFDLSVYDIFGLLNVGGAVVLPSPDRLKDPGYWKEMLDDWGVTIWNTVPALMDMLVEYLSGRNEELDGQLRLALLSGDWIPITLPDKLRAMKPDVQIISLGGATEASIWSILYPIERVDSQWKSIPYGKPLANQTFHVLDTAMRDCPTWVPGRLYIGGTGLALGYCNDKPRTDERFVRHPTSGERLYWTGDLGRYLDDGNIEFLGREDFQVKIQGYRIELEEIESHLLTVPGVKSAAAAAVELNGERRIVAYVVGQSAIAHPSQKLSARVVQEALKERLPHYMIPSHVEFLSQLPLSTNGKVDRKALPAPQLSGRARSHDVAEPTAPRRHSKNAACKDAPFATDPQGGLPTSTSQASTTKQTLRDIWKEILSLHAVGDDENFFDLGGTSFSAVRLTNAIASKLGKNVPVVKLFRYTTVASLAEHIDDLTDNALRAVDHRSSLQCRDWNTGRLKLLDDL